MQTPGLRFGSQFILGNLSRRERDGQITEFGESARANIAKQVVKVLSSPKLDEEDTVTPLLQNRFKEIDPDYSPGSRVVALDIEDRLVLLLTGRDVNKIDEAERTASHNVLKSLIEEHLDYRGEIGKQVYRATFETALEKVNSAIWKAVEQLKSQALASSAMRFLDVRLEDRMTYPHTFSFSTRPNTGAVVE